LVERVIGTIRRECLDPVIVFHPASLHRHVKSFLARIPIERWLPNQRRARSRICAPIPDR
jgi:hypothetical protein